MFDEESFTKLVSEGMHGKAAQIFVDGCIKHYGEVFDSFGDAKPIANKVLEMVKAIRIAIENWPKVEDNAAGEVSSLLLTGIVKMVYLALDNPNVLATVSEVTDKLFMMYVSGYEGKVAIAIERSVKESANANGTIH